MPIGNGNTEFPGNAAIPIRSRQSISIEGLWGLITKELEHLLDAVKNLPSTADEKQEQRRSFAYGNTKIEKSRIAREMVDQEAEALKGK
jgi:hypothetical protein